MTDQPDELIGETLASRYWVISQLGVGGMGVAYRAWDEQQAVPVVVKIPKRAFLADASFAERFDREIRLLRGLPHPHVVPIVDVGQHQGLPFVVMRFLPGGSLSHRRLRDSGGAPRPNPPEMLHLWLPAVAVALDYVHGQGVVHRDVKPGNVFFDAFWNACLGDFGIAKILSDSQAFDREETLTDTSIGLGTPEYMAPEQFTPKAKLDGRADQYALAVMAYEMLAGVRPFRGESAHVVLEVLTKPAPSLAGQCRGLPASLVAAVHRGLAKKPEQRFATCREFAAAALADVPCLVDEPGVARLLCPQCSRILKLPVQAAGRQGNCRNCRARMMVAADLGALWLVDEERHGEAADAGAKDAAHTGLGEVDSLTSFRPLSDATRLRTTGRRDASRRRRARSGLQPWLATGGVALAVALIAVMMWPAKPPRTRPKSQPVEEPRSKHAPRVSEGVEVAHPTPAPPRPRRVPARPDRPLLAPDSQGGDALADLPSLPWPRPEPDGEFPPDAPEQPNSSQVFNSVGMSFRVLPPGQFVMGDPDGRKTTEVPHKVTLTRHLFMGMHEVTNGQWQAVMGEPPSHFKHPDHPVEMVSWYNAIAFCRKLSAMPEEKQAGRVYRLPTSAEWEYACRAGTTTRYSFGDDERKLPDHAWFAANSRKTTQPVGRKAPNPWGLFDMYGNVWEWCSDRRGAYAAEDEVDPQGPARSEDDQRVVRGGCWENPVNDPPFHTAARLGMNPARKFPGIGFRVVLEDQMSHSPAAAADPFASTPVR